jgi:hypothetical protein
MAESRLRNHLRPFFGGRAIDKVGPAEVRRWQTRLAANTGHATVQQCRSLVLRNQGPPRVLPRGRRRTRRRRGRAGPSGTPVLVRGRRSVWRAHWR